KEEGGGPGQPAADHDQPVEEGGHVREGVARGLAEAAEGLAGRVRVARTAPGGDLEDLERLGARRGSGPRPAGVFEPDAADADRVLGTVLGVELVPEGPDLPRRRVVADVDLAVADDAAAEARPQGGSDQVAEALGAASLGG